jgi:hypothetical protein
MVLMECLVRQVLSDKQVRKVFKVFKVYKVLQVQLVLPVHKVPLDQLVLQELVAVERWVIPVELSD